MNRSARFLVSSVVLVVLRAAVLGSSLTAAPAATVPAPMRSISSYGPKRLPVMGRMG